MNSDEVRSAFLSFFEEKEHKVIPSSSLIPKGDPTLLLTTAGMVQIKPYFLGQAVPPSPRLVSCQKSFRTTDIELVGDPSHLTFFEMLGNFSVGDYFKKEAIEWAWEFVVTRLKLPPERLWITVFLDDDESFGLWRDIGIAGSKIVRLGEKDNFWGPTGDSGPCGPCSEILYDLGEDIGCGIPDCAPGCECQRFSEIWNLVFTQYNQDRDGYRTLLPKPNIDTGMGLERTVAVMQGKMSVYDTDIFVPLMNKISELSGKRYDADDASGNAMRVIAEHGRGLAFLIGDGVIPSNEGRGYVLRRLLRRAALFGRKLGLDKPFLSEIAETTIWQMKHVYPELEQRQGFILKVIQLEEARFSETLNTGLELLDNIVGTADNRGMVEISGKDAFKLYDTYGFPVELTAEVAGGRGFTVDLAGFEREMQKQRERAKATQKFGGTLMEIAGLHEQLGIEETPFIGYQILEHKSAIISLLVNGRAVETIAAGQEASVVIETTPFYGEMGGQVGDTGDIFGGSGHFTVENSVRVPTSIVVHQGQVTEGSLSVGDEVTARVHGERRLDIARNHTATHLLHSALRQVLGEHVQQRGSLVAPDQLRFDFSHLKAMTQDEIKEVNRIVNGRIRQNLAVYDEEISYDETVAAGAIALFDEKYGDVVRVLKVGRPSISAELCGGTHVNSSGEIGHFHITGESSIGAGLRRIEAVTGRVAEGYIDRFFTRWQEIAQIVGASMDNVSEKVSSAAEALEAERKRAQDLERKLAIKEVESLLGRIEEVNGVKVLVAKVPPSRMEILREMGDLLRERLKSVVVVLGTVYDGKPAFVATVTPDLVAQGYHAGEIVKQVARVTGGGGGGRANLAQAGGKDKDKIDAALQLVKSLI